MSSIVDNSNLIIYLKDNHEIKSLKKIEKSIGRSIKIKDLKNFNILSELNSARSIGSKTLDLLVKYIDLDKDILKDNLSSFESKLPPRWSINYNLYSLLKKLDLDKSRANLNLLIASREEPKLSELNQHEIENSIIKNIEIFFSELNDREKFIFASHYGYKKDILTLEDTAYELSKIEKTRRLTRERIRQLINAIKKKILYKPYFNLPELVEYLEKIQSQSFHEIFPNLDKIFTDTAKTQRVDISGDRLNQFLADLTGKKKNHYKTPELLLKSEFDKDELNEIFLEQPYGISEDLFTSEVKTLFGFDDLVTKRAIKFMDDNKLILHKNNKIYPLKLYAFEEVAHICLKFPKGIFWKDIYEILNNSPSKNKFSTSRLVADHKIGNNKYIWLCAKGTHKHYNYLKHKEDRDKIIQSVYDALNKKGAKALRLAEVFNFIKSNKLLRNIDLDYHELRAFIKLFGKEKGIFWKGKSNVDTISLNKNFNYLKNIDNILNIINNSPVAIHEKQIIKLMDRGTDISTLIPLHGEELLKEKKVMRVGPKLWYNYNRGLDLCDVNLLREETTKLFNNYDTVSLHYITNYLNKKLNLALSYYFYDSIFESMSDELKLFFYNSYISKKDEKFTSEKIYRNYFQDNLDLYKNIEQIAGIQRIAVSPQQFVNAKYIFI